MSTKDEIDKLKDIAGEAAFIAGGETAFKVFLGTVVANEFGRQETIYACVKLLREAFRSASPETRTRLAKGVGDYLAAPEGQEDD